MLQTISITVSGKVQGVFYRQSAKEIAKEIGITGEVKNVANGSVYILATGTKVQLDNLVAWCRHGPPKANVLSIETKELSIQQFDGFSIVRR